MPPSTSSKKSGAGPRRKGRQDRDDEGLDEAPQLLDDEPADMEQANPVEEENELVENEPVENEPVDETEDADDPHE